MTSPERVGIVGTGLIGTSVGLAALRAGDEVRGTDVDPHHRAEAGERLGVRIGGDIGELARWASLIVVATPIAAVAGSVLEALAASLDVLVTDVASVKSTLATEIASRVGDATASARYIGGHPMGGTERTGPTYAAAGLLDGATWILTPSPENRGEDVQRVEAWVRRLGADPVRLSAERHDRLVATVSHLPQIASTALMNLAAGREAGEPDALILAAGGFRDLTRLAASNPALWAEILTANRDEVLAAIDEFVDVLGEVRDRVSASDCASVEGTFARAKESRLGLTTRARVRSGVAVLLVPMPDRPGALAAITTALGTVNIEDVQIVHSTEGGAGMAHLTVAIGAVQEATEALASAGHAALRIA